MKTETSTIVYSNLADAFEVKSGEVISLVGGGGKTTLMFAIAAESVAAGNKVITTTTTKILVPDSTQTPMSIVGKMNRR